MRKCFRHFKALMRKNLILWVRSWGCSTFEIIAPVILMTALAIIRSKVPVTPVDEAGLLGKTGPSMIGVGPKGMYQWDTTTDSNPIIDDRFRPVACHSSYFSVNSPDDCNGYSLAYDKYSF